MVRSCINRISGLMAGAGFILIACCTAASAQRPALPDLVISDAYITKDSTGLFADKITVTVKNGCSAKSPASYVLVTFKVSNAPDAKAIYYIGNTVKPLKGGESFTQIFPVGSKKIGAGRFVFVEADPYKKVAETDETNNWRTLNPADAGKPGSCSIVH